MRKLYLAAGIAQLLSGVMSMVMYEELFRGFGGDVGLIAVCAGLLHILNWEYGLATRGVRYGALLAGIPATILALWQAVPTAHWQETIVVALSPICLLLSFSTWTRIPTSRQRETAQ